jgi:hypothetical protein
MFSVSLKLCVIVTGVGAVEMSDVSSEPQAMNEAARSNGQKSVKWRIN